MLLWTRARATEGPYRLDGKNQIRLLLNYARAPAWLHVDLSTCTRAASVEVEVKLFVANKILRLSFLPFLFSPSFSARL